VPAGEGRGINQAGLPPARAAGGGGTSRRLAGRTQLLRGREARIVAGATLVEAQARRVSDGGSIPPASTIPYAHAPAPEDGRLPKTIYRVDGSSSGGPSPRPGPSPAGERAHRRTLWWVLLALLAVIIVMIVIIAVLAATENEVASRAASLAADPGLSNPARTYAMTDLRRTLVSA
jgi:hypothetical protein